MLTAEEREEGQKSYQRIRLFNRNQPTRRTWIVVTLMVGVIDYSAFHNGHRASGIFWTLFLAGTAFQYWRKKVRFNKDYKFLEQLKLKNGPEIYSEIEKAPASLYYRTFQKIYWPDSRRKITVSLP